MLNLWLGGAVCAICVAVGWCCHLRYRKRHDVLTDLVALLVFAAEQIQYDMASLPTICQCFAALHPHSVLGAACRDYPTLSAPPSALPADQWQRICGLLLDLGRSDRAGQTRRIAYAQSCAEQMCADAARAVREKGDLYAKLCVLAGVGLMIWMV